MPEMPSDYWDIQGPCPHRCLICGVMIWESNPDVYPSVSEPWYQVDHSDGLYLGGRLRPWENESERFVNRGYHEWPAKLHSPPYYKGNEGICSKLRCILIYLGTHDYNFPKRPVRISVCGEYCTTLLIQEMS